MKMQKFAVIALISALTSGIRIYQDTGSSDLEFTPDVTSIPQIDGSLEVNNLDDQGAI